MPTYTHLAHCCNYEWEDFYSIKADPPTICPKCQTEGQVERLISGGSGRGIVELTGKELIASIKTGAQEIQKDALRNESTLANIVGEKKYHENTLSYERDLRDSGFRRRR